MKRQSVKSYSCPSCERPTLTSLHENAVGDEIMKGSLVCQNCSAAYPIKGYIPRFVSDENYSRTFGFQWNLYAKTQLDSYTGRSISRKRLFDVTGWPSNMADQCILEAGSGAGRFTEILLQTGATVFSFDYSSAVDANWDNNGQNPRLHLFQGDIYHIPLRPCAFDKVICIGVLQHTPNPNAALQCLAKYVRPGGELVVDSYKRSWASLLQWKYLLRPLTKRMDQQTLHGIIVRAVPALLPISRTLRRTGGRVGARLLPIVDYSHLGLPKDLETLWAILDTFDMYAPAHDHPASMRDLRKWLREAKLIDVSVRPASNGWAAKGRRPLEP